MILLCGKDPVGTTTQAKTLAAETGNLVCDSGSQDHGPWTAGAAPFSRTAPPQRTRTLSVLRGMKLGSLHIAPFSGLPPSVCKDVNPAWRQTCTPRRGCCKGTRCAQPFLRSPVTSVHQSPVHFNIPSQPQGERRKCGWRLSVKLFVPNG